MELWPEGKRIAPLKEPSGCVTTSGEYRAEGQASDKFGGMGTSFPPWPRPPPDNLESAGDESRCEERSARTQTRFPIDQPDGGRRRRHTIRAAGRFEKLAGGFDNWILLHQLPGDEAQALVDEKRSSDRPKRRPGTGALPPPPSAISIPKSAHNRRRMPPF